MTIVLYIISPGLEARINTYFTSSFNVQNGSEYETRLLPLSSWLPFDKYRHYSLAYALNTLTIVYGGNYTACSDVFFYALIIFCSGQLKILQKELRQFKQIAVRSVETNDEERAIVRKLGECVKKHKLIIQYA